MAFALQLATLLKCQRGHPNSSAYQYARGQVLRGFLQAFLSLSLPHGEWKRQFCSYTFVYKSALLAQ